MSTWIILRVGMDDPAPGCSEGRQDHFRSGAQLDVEKSESGIESAMALNPAGEGWRWSPQS